MNKDIGGIDYKDKNSSKTKKVLATSNRGDISLAVRKVYIDDSDWKITSQ